MLNWVGALNEATQDGGTHWWQIATGVIAVPAALLGLPYSWVLIKKTNLEADKIQLELEEKRRSLLPPSNSAGPRPVSSEAVVAPILEARQVQDIILRFILLYLVTRVWSLIGDVFTSAFKGITLGVYQGTGGSSGSDVRETSFYITVKVAQAVPDIALWFITVGIGWPIFLQVLRLTGTSLDERFTSTVTKRVLYIAAFVGPITTNVFSGFV